MTEVITLPENDIKDGKIEFKNLDQYLAMVNKYVEYGNNFVVTEETMKGAKDEKALINKMVKESSARRSDIENNMLAPWLPVKEKMMNAEKQLKSASDNIKVQLDKYTEELKEKWRDNIKLYIESQYQDTQYEPRIPIDEKWLYKKNFNGLEPKDSFIDSELTTSIMTDKANQKTEQNEIKMVKEFAHELNVNPSPYVKQLDSHSLPDVIEGMKFDVRMANDQREAQEAAQRAERKRAISQAQTKQVDEDTGEIIKPVEERYDRSFKVFACTRNELQEIADFLTVKGIHFEGTSEG
ncbi:hypothetical protein R55210_AODCCCNP_01152 [Fructobacillus fructosus]|uniref:DUF1351 domain-containing protein n=1 Tax=Fructobacillus fructosus TaxID=1631 RepID=UPI002DAA3598|nr:hypothetical protein R55210_AODCCCNP_01152 [Fructobacillus fructosus]